MVIRWKSVRVFVLCASAMLVAVLPAYAATGPISVIIDAKTLNWATTANCTSQLTCFNIAIPGPAYVDINGIPVPTLNGLTVQPYFTGSGQSAYARVNTPLSEATSDSLQITNTRITNTNNFDKPFTIEIQQQDSPLPGTNANQWYNTYLNGVFGPMNGNSISAQPYVKVGTGAWQNGWSASRPYPSRTVTDCPDVCATAILSSSTLKTGANINPLNGDRTLKIVFTLTLKAGSYIDFNSGGKIVASVNPPDTGPVQPPQSAWCMTTNSTAKTFGCPSCVTEDGQVAADAKVRLFASTNWDNLQQDFARGEGEHLASLATLMDIPANRRSEFFSLAQDQYRGSTKSEAPEQAIASLQGTWSRQYRSVN